MLNGIYFNGEFYDINYIFIKNSQCTKTGGTQKKCSCANVSLSYLPFPNLSLPTHIQTKKA